MEQSGPKKIYRVHFSNPQILLLGALRGSAVFVEDDGRVVNLKGTHPTTNKARKWQKGRPMPLTRTKTRDRE